MAPEKSTAGRDTLSTDEKLACILTHAIMAHYGYTDQQIAAAEETPDHAALGCEWTGQGWCCEDEAGKPIHPDHDELARTADLMVDVVIPTVAAHAGQADMATYRRSQPANPDRDEREVTGLPEELRTEAVGVLLAYEWDDELRTTAHGAHQFHAFCEVCSGNVAAMIDALAPTLANWLKRERQRIAQTIEMYVRTPPGEEPSAVTRAYMEAASIARTSSGHPSTNNDQD